MSVEARDVLLGLTSAEVASRVAEGRTNDVPVRASRSVWEIVRANVFTGSTRSSASCSRSSCSPGICSTASSGC